MTNLIEPGLAKVLSKEGSKAITELATSLEWNKVMAASLVAWGLIVAVHDYGKGYFYDFCNMYMSIQLFKFGIALAALSPIGEFFYDLADQPIRQATETSDPVDRVPVIRFPCSYRWSLISASAVRLLSNLPLFFLIVFTSAASWLDEEREITCYSKSATTAPTTTPHSTVVTNTTSHVIDGFAADFINYQLFWLSVVTVVTFVIRMVTVAYISHEDELSSVQFDYLHICSSRPRNNDDQCLATMEQYAKLAAETMAKALPKDKADESAKVIYFCDDIVSKCKEKLSSDDKLTSKQKNVKNICTNKITAATTWAGIVTSAPKTSAATALPSARSGDEQSYVQAETVDGLFIASAVGIDVKKSKRIKRSNNN